MSSHPVTARYRTVKDCLLILFITAVIYIPFLGLPGWDGNEPLRVIVAKGMLEKGNWIIPMLHGNPYFTKPPLMNWLIAASIGLFNTINEWTTRFPSVLIVFVTGILIYFMTSKWLKREGRFFAAIATLSMLGLIKKGRTAEIDSLFIFFVMLILLIWINGYVRQWKPVILWCISLSLVGIGFLAKGPQVVAYFYLTVFGYLFLKKRLSFFFSISHGIGILMFFLVLVVYLSFVLQWVTFDDYMKMWASQIIDRAESKQSFSFLEHLVSYPLEGIGSFMPCLLFIIPVILYKDLRRESKEVFQNEILVFSLVMIIVNFPLYWVLPNARFRYFLPAGPFVAMAVAVFFEFYLNKAKEKYEIEVLFKRLLKIFSWTAIISAFIIVPVIMVLHLQFSLSLLSLMVAVMLFALFILYRLRSIQLRSIPVLLVLLTGLFFLIYTDIDIQYDSKKDNYPRKIAGEINHILPHDTGTVYELGYRRFLGITCYVTKEVLQLDNFSDLKSLQDKGTGVYFIFDTKFLSTRDEEEKRIFTQDIRWEKVYSKYFTGSRGEIVIGYLK